MSVAVPSITLVQPADGLSIVVTDTTVYNGITPTSLKLTILNLIDNRSVVISPLVWSSGIYTLNTVNLGFSTTDIVMPDGIYFVKYEFIDTVPNPDINYSTENTILCFKTYISGLNTGAVVMLCESACKCTSVSEAQKGKNRIYRYYLVERYLRAAIALERTGYYTKSQTLIDRGNRLIDTHDCGCN